MGTPDFAVATLSALVDAGYNVVGVITAPDRPAGRGRKMQASVVKEYALQQGLSLLQPTNLKDTTFLDALRSLNGNLQIVVAFRMLPKAVWAMPEFGTFNLHASLLPNYRGAAPINWAIINGETKTGVTTFFIDAHIDTGEIILQEETTIADNDTAGTLHDRLMHLGAATVLETVELIKHNRVEPHKQAGDAALKKAPKIYNETCKIDWSAEIDTIYDHIRGLSPYPAAWSNLINGTQTMFVKIYKSTKFKETHGHPIGQILIDKREMKVAVKGGYLILLEIQLPGKRKMPVKEVLNGLKLEETAHMA